MEIGNFSALHYPFPEIPAPGSCLEVRPGLLWLRMPLPMTLDHINLYLLADGEGWCIVDTGLQNDRTRQLWEQLFLKDMGGAPVTRVVVTHMHPDHVGLAGWLCQRREAPLYMTRSEYLCAVHLMQGRVPGLGEAAQSYFRRAGLEEATLQGLEKLYSKGHGIVAPLPDSYHRLEGGQQLLVGGREWRVVIGRGHSPEHACLYCEELGVLLAGDQVIPRITSNISVLPLEPEGNPLAEWLESLRRFLQLPADTLVLPAHNEPFFGLHERLHFLLDYHEQRMDLLLEACRRPRTVMQLLPVLFQRELDLTQISFALGEALSHLHLLMARGRMQRTLHRDGHYLYKAKKAPPKLLREAASAEKIAS